MITHLPLNSHSNPKNILVIGGGDGLVLREIIKNPHVTNVVLVEIDRSVVEVSKKYFKNSFGFYDPKVNVVIGDGFEYLKNCNQKFDVIITDSSDPIGPAEVLFTENFYRLLSDSLADGGIVPMVTFRNN
jgi:spermidine synthase